MPDPSSGREDIRLRQTADIESVDGIQAVLIVGRQAGAADGASSPTVPASALTGRGVTRGAEPGQPVDGREAAPMARLHTLGRASNLEDNRGH